MDTKKKKTDWKVTISDYELPSVMLEHMKSDCYIQIVGDNAVMVATKIIANSLHKEFI